MVSTHSSPLSKKRYNHEASSQAGHFPALTHPVVHAETPAATLAHCVTTKGLAGLATSHYSISLPWGVIWPLSKTDTC